MRVLDLFAGTGVGVAVRNLGWEDLGVEIEDHVVATREVNGLQTVYRDVWSVERAGEHSFTAMWASPPCQAFSTTGNGAGLRALKNVLTLIQTGEYRDLRALRDAGDQAQDPRVGLVLTPLHYAVRFQPEHLVFEQVPSVLPLWEACRPELEALGYSVWAGKLDAVNYGVPQTRVRAFLIASKTRPVGPPPPQNLQTLEAVRPDQAGLISNYSHNGSGGIELPGNKLPRGFRAITEPAFTATSKVTSQKWYPSMENVTVDEAKLIQGYPDDFVFTSQARLQIGNAVPPPMAEAILRTFI